MAEITKLCEFCGIKFLAGTKGGGRRYCSKECQRLHHNKVLRDNQKEKTAKKKNRRDPIEETIHEMVLYNKAHGTDINYGQWVAGVRKGHGA